MGPGLIAAEISGYVVVGIAEQKPLAKTQSGNTSYGFLISVSKSKPKFAIVN